MLPLTSGRLLVVLALGVLGFLVLAVRTVRSRGLRHRRVLGAGSLVMALTLLLAGTAAAVNRHFGLYHSWSALFGVQSRDLVPADTGSALTKALAPLPSGAPARTHGQLLSLHIPGTLSGLSPGGALVYLPPQYGAPGYTGRGFPVIEAIPGSPGSPVDYINGMQADTQLDRAITDHVIPPAIVVFPSSNISRLR